MLIDTHCHLVSSKLKEQTGELIQNAKDVGVSHIINIAYNPETLDIALEQAALHPELFATVGIQPHDSQQYTHEVAEKMWKTAQGHEKLVAVGEIGLDDFHKLSPMEQQIKCFEHWLDIALREDLPVVVHVRETFDNVHSRLKEFAQNGGRGVIHCFTGTMDEGKAFLDLGFYLSFSGIVTFKNCAELREVAKIVPNDKILVETDSPYLAPVPYRGKKNQPAWVRQTAELVAEERGVAFEDFAKQTTLNATELFRLKLT